MFSYYGSKSKIVDYYPPPKHKRIIEPFAGSAKYALKYWQNDVLLVDKYEAIINVWQYLKTANKKEILNLPILKPKEDLRNFKTLSDEEKLLIGFCINPGSISPKNVQSGTGRFAKYWQENRNIIADNLYKIKHWEIKLGSYDEIGNIEATWFVDPPYEFGGEHYKESNKNIDFNKLSEWCKSRNGQVIVCENTKAKWMNFKPIIEQQGSVYKTTEAIWSNHKTNYDNVQVSLFEGM